MVVGLVVAWAFDGSGETARTGEQAPDFSVELLDGGRFDLDAHLAEDGRPLVLNLWASWCLPCREEIPDLSTFATDHPEIAVVGVAVEDRLEDARVFAAELRPSYPLAFANPGFDDSYPNFGLPVTYFIDHDGVVTDVFNGVLTIERLEDMVGQE